ncbi:MAG: hypothetical protein IT488_05895 [Gammaproteobacteria bacterium]|nr:hypothetical protein [Gammaproteobacteria bacterium]
MPEIGEITPTQPTWGRRPVDRIGPDKDQSRSPRREKPSPREDGEEQKDDPRGGQIDEYA